MEENLKKIRKAKKGEIENYPSPETGKL